MKAAIIGGGVIGGGWAARFLLNGWNVDVYDPDPECARKINAVLDNARRALPALYDVPMPPEGALTIRDRIADAVTDATWIQESVSERLDLKHKVFKEVSEHISADAILGSSTSGFKPSELNAMGAMAIVAHPFNPVYLLPLIELVGDADQCEAAAKVLAMVGMYPLHIKAEIDAHIADRLLEAVWREALWLIKDDIATTAEIDEAIRMGFGLRWAQMGLFETYRIAGGEAGMRHFIEQFGPCLSWPWTKLMDVPELTDDLIDKIASQSDVQSGMHSIRELERIRDVNLVDFMRSLKSRNWGAGEVVLAHETSMRTVPQLETRNDALITMRGQVLPSWVDYNGHMTEFRYGMVIADAADFFIIGVGVDVEHAKTKGSYFTVESHLNYLEEMKLGDAFEVQTHVLMHDAKKLHLAHAIVSNGETVATGEQFLLFIDHASKSAATAPDDIQAKIGDLADAYKDHPRPPKTGKLGQRP